MFIKSIKDIIEISKKENIDFFEVMLNSDIEERRISKEESFNQMKNIYNEMKKFMIQWKLLLITGQTCVAVAEEASEAHAQWR